MDIQRTRVAGPVLITNLLVAALLGECGDIAQLGELFLDSVFEIRELPKSALDASIFIGFISFIVKKDLDLDRPGHGPGARCW